MTYKAKVDFLWYTQGQSISDQELEENVKKWKDIGVIEVVGKTKEESISVVQDDVPQGIRERIKDYAEDLLDDGKRNRSNRKRKTKGKK